MKVMKKFYPQSHLNHYSYYEPVVGYQLTEFYQSPQQNTLSPFKESVRACQLIYEKYQKPLIVCLSGGLDSECMIQAVQASEVPYKVAIMRFVPDFNKHDIIFAEEYCRLHHIKPTYYDIDIIQFYESGEFCEYAIKYRTNSPQFCAHIWMADQIEDGVVLLAGSSPYLNYYDKAGTLLKECTLFTPEDKEYATDRLFQIKNKPGVAHFFQYTTELYFSFLFKTIAGSSLKIRHKYALNNHYEFKKTIFKQGGFNTEIFVQRNEKFTGFEKVKEYYASLYGAGDSYEKLFRLPLQQMHPEQISIKTMIPRNLEKMFYKEEPEQ